MKFPTTQEMSDNLDRKHRFANLPNLALSVFAYAVLTYNIPEAITQGNYEHASLNAIISGLSIWNFKDSTKRFSRALRLYHEARSQEAIANRD